MINFDNNLNTKEENIKLQKRYYLIDRNFYENLKKRLNYDEIINQNNSNREEETVFE